MFLNFKLCKIKTPEGYYFDSSDRFYKECFETCKYCYGPGDKKNNNCTECKSGFKFLDDSESNTNNCYEICPSYYYFNKSNNNEYTCTEKCKDKYNYTILSKKKCVSNCAEENRLLVKFNDICMNQCPKETRLNFETKKCELDNTRYGNLVQKDFMTISLQQSIIDGSFNDVINDIIKKEKDYTISDNNIKLQITTSNYKTNKQNNISSVNIGECEIILKERYGIEDSIPLIILKRDYFSNETLIPLIGYEVYHPINYSKLDLSYCNNSVSLNIPAKINEDKIYQYDPTSDYYNDKCSSYTSDNGTDILLFDRKKEYTENNLALCEANCIYKGYDRKYKQSICDCNIEKNIEYISNISNNPNVLSQDFNVSEDDYGYANVFACTKNLFSVNGILKNMSSDILIVSILFFAGTSLFFRKRGYNILVNQINNIINDKMNYQTKIIDNI